MPDFNLVYRVLALKTLISWITYSLSNSNVNYFITFPHFISWFKIIKTSMIIRQLCIFKYLYLLLYKFKFLTDVLLDIWLSQFFSAITLESIFLPILMKILTLKSANSKNQHFLTSIYLNLNNSTKTVLT